MTLPTALFVIAAGLALAAIPAPNGFPFIFAAVIVAIIAAVLYDERGRR